MVNPDGTITYTPSADFFGVDTYSYTVTDADGDVSTATVTVTVSPVDDQPAANADSDTLAERQAARRGSRAEVRHATDELVTHDHADVGRMPRWDVQDLEIRATDPYPFHPHQRLPHPWRPRLRRIGQAKLSRRLQYDRFHSPPLFTSLAPIT